MIKRTTKTVEQEVVEDVICNVCGKSTIGKDCGNICGLVANVGGNYDSTHLPDDESHLEFAICEKCLVEKVFPLFTILPEKS